MSRSSAAGSSPKSPAPRGSGWDPRFHLRSELFWPIRPFASAFASFADWPAVDDYPRALGEGFPVRFREQPPRPRRRGRRGALDPATLYDARIHVEGWVPTRPRNWHDFLNMLVWAAFPRAKAALHARQHRAISARLDAGARSLPGARTREQDGLALLDEGGLVLLCEAGRSDEVEPRWAADLRDAPGRGLPLVQRALRRDEAAVLVFGHALYESLVEPGPLVYAMVQPLSCKGPLPSGPSARVALADALLREALEAPASFTCPERFGRLPLDDRILCDT